MGGPVPQWKSCPQITQPQTVQAVALGPGEGPGSCESDLGLADCFPSQCPPGALGWGRAWAAAIFVLGQPRLAFLSYGHRPHLKLPRATDHFPSSETLGFTPPPLRMLLLGLGRAQGPSGPPPATLRPSSHSRTHCLPAALSPAQLPNRSPVYKTKQGFGG